MLCQALRPSPLSKKNLLFEKKSRTLCIWSKFLFPAMLPPVSGEFVVQPTYGFREK